MTAKTKRRIGVLATLAVVIAVSLWWSRRVPPVPEPGPARVLLPFWQGEAVGLMDVDGKVVMPPAADRTVVLVGESGAVARLGAGWGGMDRRLAPTTMVLVTGRTRQDWEVKRDWPIVASRKVKLTEIFDSAMQPLLVAEQETDEGRLEVIGGYPHTYRRRAEIWVIRDGELICVDPSGDLAGLLPPEPAEMLILGPGRAIMRPDAFIMWSGEPRVEGPERLVDETGQVLCSADSIDAISLSRGRWLVSSSNQTDSKVILDWDGQQLFSEVGAMTTIAESAGYLLGHDRDGGRIVLINPQTGGTHEWQLEGWKTAYVETVAPLRDENIDTTLVMKVTDRWVLLWLGDKLRILDRDLNLVREVELLPDILWIEAVADDGSWILAETGNASFQTMHLFDGTGRTLAQPMHLEDAAGRPLAQGVLSPPVGRVFYAPGGLLTPREGETTKAGLITLDGELVWELTESFGYEPERLGQGWWVPSWRDEPGGLVDGEGLWRLRGDGEWRVKRILAMPAEGTPSVVWWRSNLARVDDGPEMTLIEPEPESRGVYGVVNHSVLLGERFVCVGYFAQIDRADIQTFSPHGQRWVVYDRQTQAWLPGRFIQRYEVTDQVVLLVDEDGKGGYLRADGQWLGQSYDYAPALKKKQMGWGF